MIKDTLLFQQVSYLGVALEPPVSKAGLSITPLRSESHSREIIASVAFRKPFLKKWLSVIPIPNALENQYSMS